MVLKTPNVVKSFMKNHAPCALYSKKSRFTNANASYPLMSDAGNSVQRPSGHSGFSRCGISKIVYGLQSVAV